MPYPGITSGQNIMLSIWKDIFAIQDEIALKILTAIQTKLTVILFHDCLQAFGIDGLERITGRLYRGHGFGSQHGVDHRLFNGLYNGIVDDIKMIVIDIFEAVYCRLFTRQSRYLNIIGRGETQKDVSGRVSPRCAGSADANGSSLGS